MIIGNIIGESKPDMRDYFSYLPSIEIDDRAKLSVPTLIVGYKKLQELGIEITDFETNQLRENLFWTFSEEEKYYNYTKDKVKFIDYCINSVQNEKKYYYLDVCTSSMQRIKNFIKILSDKSILKKIYISQKGIYILYNDNIIGIDRGSLDFIGVKGIQNKIAKISNNFILRNELHNIPREIIRSVKSEYLYSIFI